MFGHLHAEIIRINVLRANTFWIQPMAIYMYGFQTPVVGLPAMMMSTFPCFETALCKLSIIYS